MFGHWSAIVTELIIFFDNYFVQMTQSFHGVLDRRVKNAISDVYQPYMLSLSFLLSVSFKGSLVQKNVIRQNNKSCHCIIYNGIRPTWMLASVPLYCNIRCCHLMDTFGDDSCTCTISPPEVLPFTLTVWNIYLCWQRVNILKDDE